LRLSRIPVGLKRGILIVFGTFSLGLGLIGIFLPIIPTTPLLLLAAACYSRSSTRFNNWLLNNRLFGSYIKNYREGRGMPIVAKIFTLSLLWITITISSIMLGNILISFFMLMIAVAISTHIIMLKNLRKT
jgi:uncharacterized membrane protein YbaN (DUF454 family)